jgi:hypothetical protein
VLVAVDDEERPRAAVTAVLLLHLLRRRAAALAVVAASVVAPARTSWSKIYSSFYPTHILVHASRRSKKYSLFILHMWVYDYH